MNESSLFLSSASSDLANVRERLAEHLRSAGFKVVHQKELVETGENTLIKLAESIQHESDIVIHVLGVSPGSVPKPDELDRMLEYCGEQKLRQRFPKLFDNDTLRRLTYTFWEAWLALFHNKRVCVFTVDTGKSESVSTGSDNPLPLDEHLDLLKPHCGYPTGCSDENDLFQHVKTSLLRLLNRMPTGVSGARRPVQLPYSSMGTLFKGRDDFLNQLRASLRRGGDGATTAVTGKAVHGLGGVGKTRLAVEYAWQHADEFSAILFVTADTPENLRRNLAELVGPLVLDLKEQVATEEDVRVAAALRWLGEHPGWFLILDNVDTEEAATHIENLLANLHGGQVLITSRLARWHGNVQALELDVLSVDDAAQFLLQRTDPHGTRGRKLSPDDERDAAELAKDLDGLALALEQAAAYIVARRKSLAEYIQLWKEHDARVQTWHDPREMKYPRSVAVTWETTLEQLGDDERQLLNLLAWFDAEPIPLSVITPTSLTECLQFEEKNENSEDTENAESASDDWDGERLDAALANLADYSMLRWHVEAETVTVHRVVQEILRTRQDQPRAKATACLCLLAAALPSGEPEDVRTWPAWAPLRAHVAFAVGEAERLNIDFPSSYLMNELGKLLFAKALYAEAEPLMHRALAIDEQSYGADHPIVARDLNDLAQLLLATNRLAEAEPLMRRALIIDEQSYGADHPSVARDLNNLGRLLMDTDRLAAAEPLMRRALAIEEQSCGVQHSNVANVLSNLAVLLLATNRLAEAEPLMRRALTIEEQNYGDQHPRVANVLNNLAVLLQETNRLAEAEPLMRRALAIEEQSFGDQHPRVANVLWSIAFLLRKTGRLDEARMLMERTRRIHQHFESANGYQLPNSAIFHEHYHRVQGEEKNKRARRRSRKRR